MRIFHLADLHIGKIVNGFSMIKEQEYILNQIIGLIEKHQPQVVMIAGDVYDKRNPSNEAVVLFSSFLTKLTNFDLDVLIVSGNHDSGAKLQFVSEILRKQRIHISGSFIETIDKVTIDDEFGKVNFYLMPFVRPSDVRMFILEVDSYHSALQLAIANSDIDYSQRNIFVGHQFFAGTTVEQSDSEIASVGGIDIVGYSLLEDFDYAALGHLHKAQKLKHDHIRYSGSPLKYSDSEVGHQKSLVMIDFKEKADLSLSLLELSPKTQMRKIKGRINDILAPDFDLNHTDDFVHITLLDDEEIIDAIGKLRNKYPNLMSLQFDNRRTKHQGDIDVRDDVSESDPVELFSDFFVSQNNQTMNQRQMALVKRLMEGAKN